jgi:hypothetical protein
LSIHGVPKSTRSARPGRFLLGWSAEELRGRDMHEAVHHLRADGTPFPREDCALLGVLRSGDEFAETHDTFVRRDGNALAGRLRVVAGARRRGDRRRRPRLLGAPG